MEDTEQENSMNSQNISVSSSCASFLQRHADIVSTAFRNAFREKVSLTVIGKELIHVKASRISLSKLELMLMDEPVKLYHSSTMKTWLTQNSESWFALINSLTKEYLCAIHTETNFSKTYIFIAPHHNKQVSSKINNFLSFKEAEVVPEDIDPAESLTVCIYKPFVDYLKNDKEMATILKIKKQQRSPDIQLVKMDFSHESLEILRSKLETITSKSCILSESEAQLFMTIDDKIFSDIKQKYQVIGNIFKPKSSIERLVFTPQTRMICLVSSKPDYLLVDNYIRLEYCFSHNLAEYTIAKKFPSKDTIWKGETWNLPFNQRLFVELPVMQVDGMRVDFENVLAECFQILDDGTDTDFRSEITGIYLTAQNPKVLKQFCSGLVTALDSFDQKHPSDSSSCKCIALIADTLEIQAIIAETFSMEEYHEKMKAEDIKNVIHGAIPKTSAKPQQRIQEDKPELWVKFCNFSGNPENLTLAVQRLKEKVTEKETDNRMTSITRIHRDKLENLLFFFEEEVTEAIPDIKDHLTKSRGEIITIVVPKDSRLDLIDKFKYMQMKINNMIVDGSIQERSMLESIVLQCNHNFPNVKCTYMDKKASIFLESLNVEDLMMVERKIMSLLNQPRDQENQNRNTEELSGNIQRKAEKFPGNIQVKAEKFPGNIQEKAEKLSGNIQREAEKFPGNIQVEAEKFPGNIQEKAEKFPGDIEVKAEKFPGNIQEKAEKLPQSINENTQADLGSEQTHSSNPAYRVLCDDLLSVDADVIVCLVSSNLNKMPTICKLILNQAGSKVKHDLISCYKEHSNNILPEGKVVFTYPGNLKCKLIFYISCPKYNISKPDNNIQDKLTIAMRDFFKTSEQQCIQSIAFPILGAGSFDIPLDVYLNSILDGITSFTNQNSDMHLQVISFVDEQEDNCIKAINIFKIYKVPFKHNLKSRRQRRIARQQTLIPCSVCFGPVADPKTFDDCKHEYCSKCLDKWLEVVGEMCPLCLNMKPQPPGEMLVRLSKTSLPGFEAFHTFHITYKIPDGIQQEIHPNPGKQYHGTQREAYLPASEVGECILKMLQEAYKKHLIFTVGCSLTSKQSDVVIWNGILHKTKQIGGPSVYGYPDPLYLSHVMAQLMEIGITPESVSSETIVSEIKMTAFD